MIMQAFKQYLQETLGIDVKVRSSFSGERSLPFYLQDSYNFYALDIMGRPYVAMVDEETDDAKTPATVRKHVEQVEERVDCRVIYVRPTISAYNRKRMIEMHLPFVVPGNQMYLPDLAIDLREYFRSDRLRVEKFVSPVTQAVVIFQLTRQSSMPLTPFKLANTLGYTPTSMTRVMAELESAGLATIHNRGRERRIDFLENKHDLWDQARPMLRSPVKRKVWVRRHDADRLHKIPAGLSALAERSMLNPPRHPVYAVGADYFRALEEKHIFALPFPEEDDTELEIWSYRPEPLEMQGTVDPFSLYLSLQDSGDERIQGALDELMAHVEW